MNIVLFDGICNLCNSSVSLLIKYDTENNLHFAAQQTDSGKRLMKQYGIEGENQSVILISGDKVFYKSDAIIEISKQLKGWPRILKYGHFIPKGIRNVVYDLVAKNRYRIFGKRDFCSIPTPANRHKFL